MAVACSIVGLTVSTEEGKRATSTPEEGQEKDSSATAETGLVGGLREESDDQSLARRNFCTAPMRSEELESVEEDDAKMVAPKGGKVEADMDALILADD